MKRSLNTLLMVVLLAVVAVQGYYLYRLDNRLEAVKEGAAAVTTPDFDLPAVPSDPRDWDPYAELQRMQDRINRLFNDAFAQFESPASLKDGFFHRRISPSLDLKDEGDRYRLKIDLPGAEESNIDVTVEGDRILSIEATTKKREVMKERDSGRILKRERYIGRFQRKLTLPEAVDPDSMESDYEDGVLTLTIRKRPS